MRFDTELLLLSLSDRSALTVKINARRRCLCECILITIGILCRRIRVLVLKFPIYYILGYIITYFFFNSYLYVLIAD